VETGAGAGRAGKSLSEVRSFVVLLVEDEPLIALTLVDLIEELGHMAVEAMTAADALRIFRSRDDIDLLITDIGLPDLAGDQLAVECRKLAPGLPVIFATGHNTGPDPVGALPVPPTLRLAKPFQMDELQAAITRVMTSRSAA
jgi:DNA-binding response OmpR family regulator